MRLEGKVAFITGSGMAVGRVSGLLFAKERAKIVAVDVNEEAGEETINLVKGR